MCSVPIYEERAALKETTKGLWNVHYLTHVLFPILDDAMTAV